MQPWVWNKRNKGKEGRYRYHRNPHPLGIHIETMLNFKYMHSLLHPNQTRHIGDPNSNVQPNRIGMQQVTVRSVNIRQLTLDTSTIHMVNQNNTINQKTHPQNRPKTVKTPPMTSSHKRPMSGPPKPPRGPPRGPKSVPPQQRKQTAHPPLQQRKPTGPPQQRKPTRPPPIPPKPSNNNTKQQQK